LPPESDWTRIYLIIPRRSCATGNQVVGPAMRRRHKGRWQYRELSPEEESKEFFARHGSAALPARPGRRRRRSSADAGR
jgi:hypothetical protein